MEKVIDITAKRDGFRRAGMVHSEQTQTYPLSQFTKEQIRLLQEEPMLVVAIRNKDDNSGQSAVTVAELNQKILNLEGDLQILVTQEADARKQLTEQAAELESARLKLTELTSELTTEREHSTTMANELEGERQKVADLTTQLEAATKKGK
ncbi:HI1506-related protein [Enterobacter asburiae]|uniref:HI1506-related protein n=1 Tax=Enterobacter asburiae TaxID=61645 RepID=UPI003EE80167